MADFYCPIVSCKSIAGIEECRNLTLLAGEQGTDRQIVWVHYVEEPSYVRFIKGKELVLTTGALLHSEEDYSRFIESLYRKNAAGLVISEQPNGEIPFLESIVALGNEMGLPIFSLPFRFRFEDISQRICREIFLCEQKSRQKGEAMCELFFGKPDQHSGALIANYDFDKKYICVVIRIGEETVLKTAAFTNQISNYLEYCFGTVTPVIYGKIYTLRGSYSPAYWIFVSVFALGSIALLILISKCREQNMSILF